MDLLQSVAMRLSLPHPQIEIGTPRQDGEGCDIWTVHLTFMGEVFVGEGRRKSVAKQEAARKAVEYFQIGSLPPQPSPSLQQWHQQQPLQQQWHQHQQQPLQAITTLAATTTIFESTNQ